MTNHYVKALNRWWFYKTGERPFKPFTTPRYAPRNWASDEEVQRLLRAAMDRTRSQKMMAMCVKLALYTGLRISEVAALDLEDVDFERRTLQVRAGKGNKFREIPLEEHVLQGQTNLCLENYIEFHRYQTDPNALFTTQKGRLMPNYL